MNDLVKEKKENATKITELAEAITLWMQTQPPRSVQQEINNIQEYVAYRMLELEVQGQKEKIEHMEKVLDLLKK